MNNKEKKESKSGYLYVVLAALLWAISGSSSKFLFNNGISPSSLVQLRVVISTVILFFILFFYNRSLLKISSKKDIIRFMLLGMAGMASVQYFYFLAISKINVSIAILLEYFSSVFIVLYTLIFTKEKISGIIIIALAGTVAGCYLVVGAYNLDILSMNKGGIIAGFFAALSFAFYTLQGEYVMHKYKPETVLFYALFGASIVWNILISPLESFGHEYSLVMWGHILFIGIIGTIVPFGLYFKGISLIRSTKANITATLEPIAAGLIAYFFLDETMESLQIFGALMVLGAIVLLQLRDEFDANSPEAVRRESKKKDL